MAQVAADVTAASSANLAQRLRAHAAARPDAHALVFPAGLGGHGWAHWTFAELDATSDAYARQFLAGGIGKGTKALLMVKPSPELFAVLFGLFKVGAIPVVVDPGMGLDRMLHCYRSAGAEALVGIPAAHVVRVLFPKSFASLRSWLTVGRKLGWSGPVLPRRVAPGAPPVAIAPATGDDLLIINFTTGSTGPAKGVEYTHAGGAAILERVMADYDHAAGDVALAPLPLFAVFHLLVGATTILPPVDPNRPAHADPARMAAAIDDFRVTHMFASPAFLRRVGRWCEARGRRLPTLRRVISGGAPVTPAIASCFRQALDPAARFYITYGATEAMPIASIEAGELLGAARAKSEAGAGACVGQPAIGLDLRVIRISDEPIARWADDLEVRAGEVGELCIAGPLVSPRYHQAPGQAADPASDWNGKHKIDDGQRRWHRTGDLGRRDAEGRVWFCGRKSERVLTAGGPLFTAEWEGVFDGHPEVHRSALVGVAGRPVVCVELTRRRSRRSRRRIAAELRARAERQPLTAGARDFRFHGGFPVDIRHNAKINRAALARWAARSPLAGALKLVPLAGWLFIVFGLLFPLTSPLWRALWWLDLVLSGGLHALQLFVSLPRARRAGLSRGRAVLMTMLFGATWWRQLEGGRS